MARKPRIPKLSNSALKRTVKVTGNDFVKQGRNGKKVKPGKGDCPANKHIKRKVKPKK